MDTSILNSSEDIEHNEVTLTSFKLLVANSTTISSSTTIIAEVEPEMDHTLLKQCLEIKAKIMVITYFIFIIYHFHIFYNFHILGEDWWMEHALQYSNWDGHSTCTTLDQLCQPPRRWIGNRAFEDVHIAT